MTGIGGDLPRELTPRGFEEAAGAPPRYLTATQPSTPPPDLLQIRRKARNLRFNAASGYIAWEKLSPESPDYDPDNAISTPGRILLSIAKQLGIDSQVRISED